MQSVTVINIKHYSYRTYCISLKIVSYCTYIISTSLHKGIHVTNDGKLGNQWSVLLHSIKQHYLTEFFHHSFTGF